MKKTLTIVLALVLALSMLASFAFVLNPGTGGAYKPDKSPLKINEFFVTSNDAILAGARIYAPLANNTDKAYAKNEVLRFAITMEVQNHLVPSNGVDASKLAKPAKMTVSSSTVDFTVSNMAGQQALHVPLSDTFVNAINSKQTNNYTSAEATEAGVAAAHGAVVTDNVMTILVTPTESDSTHGPSNSVFGDEKGESIVLYTPSSISEAKASYAFIFTGITKGEITDQGLAKLVTESTAGSVFNKTAPDGELISVVLNNRTYFVEKVTVQEDVRHPFQTTNISTDEAKPHPYYKLSKVAYRVYLQKEKTDDSYILIPVAQLDSESVTWRLGVPEIVGTQVEGLGYSLGLEKIAPAEADLTVAIPTGTDPIPAPVVDYNETPASNEQARVFRTVLSSGAVHYILGDAIGTKAVGDTAFTETELGYLNNMLTDFGFSTADTYNYKLEDRYFTTDGADVNVLTATYNNGTVTPIPTEEEGDIGEGTPEDELPEDGEEVEEDLEEDGDVIEDGDEVPAETGDFASDIALALTAAAIVAAAALAFVMKKARD